MSGPRGQLLAESHDGALERSLRAVAEAGQAWSSRESLPLAILRLGETMQLACDPAMITMIVPLPYRIPSCPGLIELTEGLGLGVPEDQLFGDDTVISVTRSWQQLELRDGEIEVVVPQPPEVQPVPRACVRPLPALLSDGSSTGGSAIPGLLGLIQDAPSLPPLVWIVDLSVFAKHLLARLELES